MSETAAPWRAQESDSDTTAPEEGLVLVVDDNVAILSVLRRLLQSHGIASVQATSGRAGLQILKSHDVDLVISDMRMPEMDGSQFLEQVRQHDPSIVRILLTGHSDIEATIAAINRGAIHRYLTKPWDNDDLVPEVRDALARRALERENAELRRLTERQNEQLRDANTALEKKVAERTAELEQTNDMLEAAYQELDDTCMAAFHVLSGLVDLRCQDVGHSRRVADVSREVARRMGLSAKESRDVYLAGLVHDIGMIGYPDEMLAKPESSYSAEEMKRHHRHTLDGEMKLMSMQNLGAVTRIVRQHHERVDGKGFPDGLAGADIAIGARILAAASALDQLSHGALGDKIYREDEACQMVLGSVDTRFDRAVVDTLIEVWTEMQSAAKADVQIDALQLKVGMILARDLLSSTGAILLAAGFVFDDKVVGQVVGYASRQDVRMSLWVRSSSVGA